MDEKTLNSEELIKKYEGIIPCLESEERLKIMLVLTGAHVLYKNHGIVIHHGINKTVKLDEEGKRIYGEMLEEGGMDYSKLEGHYKIIKSVKEELNLKS